MDQLIKLGTPQRYRKGEVLIRPGGAIGALFVIVTGMVHVYTIEESGDKNIQIIYGPDDVLPLSRLINIELSTVFYEALSDCEVLRIDVEAAMNLLRHDSQISFEVLQHVIAQLMQYKLQVDNLEYTYARERIAYRLLQLAKRFGRQHGDKLVIYRFSQEEIGSMTNVSRESVGRELRRFERLGYITYRSDQMEISNPEALRKELAPPSSPLFIDDV